MTRKQLVTGAEAGLSGDEQIQIAPRCIVENGGAATIKQVYNSGRFARRVDTALFVTTGEMTAEQRREAREARVKEIQGRDEITRIAAPVGIGRSELFEQD